jgi:hypothetical protein
MISLLIHKKKMSDGLRIVPSSTTLVEKTTKHNRLKAQRTLLLHICLHVDIKYVARILYASQAAKWSFGRSRVDRVGTRD